MKATIKLEPVPQLRTQIRVIKGKVISYTPEKSRTAQVAIASKLAEYKFEPYPPHIPLKLTVTFYRSQSEWSRSRLKDMMPVRRPDLDNFVKLLLDATNGILYEDDAQISHIVAKKRWTDRKRGYITFELKEDKDGKVRGV